MATFLDYDFVSPLPHPGEILREDFMAPLEMTAGALARAMGLKDRTRIERLARELQPVTPDTAMRLERVFSVNAQFWMNLQAQYDLSKAVVERRAEYQQLAPVGT
uniref:HigA family addiction module antitoxin n=1 Tax=uncultured Caulobacter sp. TaxID=158749 RepID=UPI0025D78F76|nr:HigA family addiction module antitoxin [uncultured Caulobacter sp.]